MENIIHSFWSLPSNKDKTTEHDRNNGGFLSEKHHAMSWALSCLTTFNGANKFLQIKNKVSFPIKKFIIFVNVYPKTQSHGINK